MSNDKKTLADVQPGGRVRLGDQAERARFEAWAKERELDTAKCSADGMKGDYADLNTDWCWAAWQAALSAQPSPGGQGDELVTDAMVYAAEEAYANSKPDNLHESFRVAIAAALAACQPAEVSEGGFRAAASRQTASAESNATAEALIAAVRQPSKQQDSVALGEATEFCIEKGDRQPVGKSVWVEVRREGDRTFPRAMTRDQADAFLRSCNVGPLPTIHSLYAAPAQAVGLGLQLDHYDTGLLGDGGGGDVGWWQDYIRTELDRAHEFYQDQADSQAVGNG
ncbi:hypothetical protein [Stenotrophomonas maltophilia]|uniref:hypothetical protein n=1 Tax=Stenotrophomonas maltophilia TaxID=40324 RepID=UPI0013DB44F5|nr:hypothetical protein [Stenotrophomonas maltophilia]